MNVAVFVDAVYLYALACAARYGTNHPRIRLSLNVEAVVRELKREVAALDGGGARLIRIYWYDGAPLAGRTAEQARVAATSDVKLRLGTVNAYGEQKGVDALIVHDLSELARNRAIDAAILVSGDEDILVGVQTAQAFGVRLHLLGIDVHRTQSEKLRFEADVCHEWAEGVVAPWIALTTERAAAPPATGEQIAEIAATLAPAIEERLPTIVETWDRVRRLPPDVNLRLMKALNTALGRTIEPHERIPLREQFVDALRALAAGGAPGDDGETNGDAFAPETAADAAAVHANGNAHATDASG
ncbi:hypothetical protein WPS_11410 [Vulcanimicrobium alpinum]|uniref:NYN domain-containing protein n=1 Tax=Vulcanimicrobium alpinum TaxID=3016050 RepID=A0AAN2C8U9_UNVUL|nr:NYN domain-containing protein [Vulcanimicrobium alpinum]BDE05865.1 hypothetical protein WPS_11410 [Vulcanimicrobium alpinum]